MTADWCCIISFRLVIDADDGDGSSAERSIPRSLRWLLTGSETASEGSIEAVGQRTGVAYSGAPSIIGLARSSRYFFRTVQPMMGRLSSFEMASRSSSVADGQ
jgi:hypothetical protein